MDRTITLKLLFSYSSYPDEETLRSTIEHALDCDVVGYEEEDN